MRNLICRKLADLASVRLQHRFIRDATVDYYMLPEDVLEDACDAIHIAQTSTSLREDERRAVEKFSDIFESSHPEIAVAGFYDTDSDWIKIRNAAASCLRQLGFDLEQRENREISLCEPKTPTNTL